MIASLYNSFKWIAAGVLVFAAGEARSQAPLLVKQIDTESYNFDELATSDGHLFFRATDGTIGHDVPWVSDGTVQGTQILKPIVGGSSFTESNGQTFFLAEDTINETLDLWITDGTESGTSLVKQDAVFIIGSFNGKLYFAGHDATHGNELWSSDGTTGGTSLVKDIFPGTEDGLTYDLRSFVFNGKLFFSAVDAVNNIELWATDGTEPGTALIKNIAATGSSYPSDFKEFNGALYFTASSDGYGNELWRTDGTDAGTMMVKDLIPGTTSSFASNLTVFNGKLYMTANLFEPYDLWQSDGTDAGTTLYEDSVAGIVTFNSLLYFGKAVGYTAPFLEYGLFKTDGTPAGVELVKIIEGANSKRFPRDMTVLGNKLYFLANYDFSGANYLNNDLWVTEGTAATTQLVYDTIDVYSGNGIVPFNGTIFYTSTYGSLYKLPGGGVGLVETTANTSNVSLFPNPALDEMLVTINADERIERITVFNTIGQLIVELKTAQQSTAKMNTSQFGEGLYLLRLETSFGKILPALFIKQ